MTQAPYTETSVQQSPASIEVSYLGCVDYAPTYDAMRAYTASRSDQSSDQIWLLEHQPVFTQGRAGKAEHVRMAGNIPVVNTDRGGQVTYHGPGQVTGYLLLDLRRRGLNIRQLVDLIEHSLIELLGDWSIPAQARADAPGVYVDGRKIASLGLRVSRGCTYHGLNLNVDMDMEPWGRINPCGLGVPMTQMRELVSVCPRVEEVQQALCEILTRRLGYTG